MGFIDNIRSCFNQSEIPSVPIYRAVIMGDYAGYFENVETILYYSEQEIALGLSKGSVKIKGDSLYIKKYCLGDVVICGRILSIERMI